MNILIASWTPKRREGGVAGVIYNLAHELEGMGHHVECLFHEDILDGPVFPRRLEGTYFAIKLARRILRQKDKFSVVNIHAPGGFAYGLMRKILSPKHSPPYVMTMHGLEERRVHAMSREAKKGKARHFGWKNRLWHRFYHQPMFRMSIRTADRAIILNREAWSYVQLKYNRDTQQVWYAPNGVEKRFFFSREYSLTATPRLLYVGAWLDQRGIYYLSDALKTLRDQVPGIRLTVAGCFTEPSDVKSVFDPSLHEQIEVVPFVPAADMPAVYARHDVFVFPSLMEGLPLALMEAMATGIPVVTTEICGMPDVVQHDVNGLLVPPADSAAIVEAILRLVQSEELRRRLGAAAQATMRQYTWDKIARRVERVFALALQNGHADEGGGSPRSIDAADMREPAGTNANR